MTNIAKMKEFTKRDEKEDRKGRRNFEKERGIQRGQKLECIERVKDREGSG